MADMPNKQDAPKRTDSAIELSNLHGLHNLSNLYTPPPPPSPTTTLPPEVESIPRDSTEAGQVERAPPQGHFHLHIPHWIFQPTLLFMLGCLIAAVIYPSATYLQDWKEIPGGHNNTVVYNGSVAVSTFGV